MYARRHARPVVRQAVPAALNLSWRPGLPSMVRTAARASEREREGCERDQSDETGPERGEILLSL